VGNLGPGDLPKDLVLLGLVGLLDPPRKEAIEAVKASHDGGIRVTMITGDHRITAAAIAKMLGIGDGKTAVTGAEIQEMDTATLQERCREVDVFARASPEHKLRLVKAMQASKCIPFFFISQHAGNHSSPEIPLESTLAWYPRRKVECDRFPDAWRWR
jgi:magnesium-transporting ATPase (P-type)